MLVTMHLINNLGHFPLISGGANLGSIVVEQDDVLGLEADQLSSQLFTAPNIQVFVTSLQQVVSLVEVPALDVPGSGAADGLISAPSQVRVIIRDLGGLRHESRTSYPSAIPSVVPKITYLLSYGYQRDESIGDY
ncbi:unnamed protein product [Nezara viridula]|uniref:Uncharacterized protein n=1 Tax=Nezara viridula TaxID=85310 RepID=A0A9P0E5D4_NEZVI|nr:unnamed protein product [Nezara viridula]